jgi:squalene-hopene/tetraprenyl-beta-curcumene cyclase
MALRLLGVAAADPALLKAKDFILKRGGISKTRIFTKFHLALLGCYDWRGLPSIPPWLMLLPDNPIFSIYEMSSWARGSTVPLLIVFEQKPVFQVEPGINLDELYSEGKDNVQYQLPKNNDWSDIFLLLDKAFKWGEENNLVPLRQESLRAAEKWILERQEVTGDWGGIIPAMLNSLLALRSLNYSVNDPYVQRGLQALDNFALEDEATYRMQACISPVWDTAWCIRALVESGVAADHARLVKAGEWLISKQILAYGDWQVKNKHGKPGGWAFEFENAFYPDVDDSAVVIMALQNLQLPKAALKAGVVQRGVEWIASMQCLEGGWAAFDQDNDKNWLNSVPYGDLKAMIDPNTADLTARVLEMVGGYGVSIAPERVKRGLEFLEKTQESDGSWFGRWGVNYIYGTSGVLSALAVIAPTTHQKQIQKGVNWLLSCQNPDGGWGETCFSYKDPRQKGKGDSTASQTAWALIGLLDGGKALGKYEESAIARGIDYLLSTQLENGTWEEPYFTGTGFPGHFYIRYHLYRHYFPLIALGRFAALALSG